jgi:osmotically-inducible protein OsmY
MDQNRQLELAQGALERPVVQKFRFGASIRASDGDAGRLTAVVVVDAPAWALTQVGIRVHPFDRHPTFVSLDRVTSATAAGIWLDLSREEIEAARSPSTGITVTRFTRVVVSQKMGGPTPESVGRLQQLTITVPSRVLRHLVVGRHWHSALLVPVELITDLTAERITVRGAGLDGLSHEQPSQLQLYRSDEELYQEVFDTLYDNVSLRVDLPGVEIHPIDGVVWLHGHVSNDSMRRLAEEEIQGITGVSAIHNALVADDTLAAAVSVALAHDPRTAGPGQFIGVYPRLGEIRLRGSVQTAGAREAAGTVAQAVTSVKRVVNELHVDPDALELHDLAGVTNQYDLVPGGR